jgi:ABC-type nitrate/sulfonate/bicarbonate transport system permease component
VKLSDYYAEYQRPLLGALAVIGFFLLWEFLLTYVFPFNPFFITKPSLIAVAAKDLMGGGKLWQDLAISSRAFIWGFSAAVVIGIPIGLVMGWRRRLEYALDPFFTALYASPLVALAPLLIVIFGVGLTGKTVLVFLLAVFPFIFNTFAGVKSTEQLLISVVRAFGGGDRDLYLKVILPSTLPYIIAGARIALGRGIVGIIVGEFYAASEGIGYSIALYGDTYRLPEMFVGIIVLMVLAVILTEGMRKLEHTLAPWRVGQEQR